MASENLAIDNNNKSVSGAITDDSNQFIKMLRIDDATKGLKVSLVGGGGSGTVTSVTQGTGILLTPSPITTTGSVALSTALQPVASLAGNALKFLRVNAGETAVEYASAGSGTVTSVGIATANGVSGSGAITTSGNITITLGAITPTTVNGNTFTTGSSTYTGTAGQTYTFPTTSATIARIDAANTFTGVQTMTSPVFNTGLSGTAFGTGVATFITTPSSANLATAVTDETGSGALVFGTNPTIAKPVMSATNPTAQTYSPAGAGTATLDLSLSNTHFITMPAGNITIALSNDTNNQPFIIRILQDSGGSRIVTWFTTIRWAGGTPPTLTTTASKADTFGFYRTGSGTYDGFVVGQNI